ncbi:MAG: IS481 family transposase [Lautropia sp.]
MNIHKNARLTYVQRVQMVQDMVMRGLSATHAAAKYLVSPATARKWYGRYLACGESGLLDKTSRPARSPRAINAQLAQTIVQLRRKLMLQSRIATYMSVSRATVSRVLRRAGLSRLSDLAQPEPVQRYEREAPGDLLHVDIKKLGRFTDVGHRITGDYRKRTRQVGWEYVFVAVDDHSRVSFTAIHPDEQKASAIAFLRAAVAHFASLGVTIRRLITDNGPAFRSHDFERCCEQLQIAHKFTRAYRPQTNGKAERFIQSALREWAYGHAYPDSEARKRALPAWNHFYNFHRAHHGIGLKTPISRLLTAGNNLLTHHT